MTRKKTEPPRPSRKALEEELHGLRTQMTMLGEKWRGEAAERELRAWHEAGERVIGGEEWAVSQGKVQCAMDIYRVLNRE